MIVRYESDGSIVMITQNDHAQLSGLFAAHWGNETFEKPRPYPSLGAPRCFMTGADPLRNQPATQPRNRQNAELP